MLNFLTSLSTMSWRYYLWLLGQFQNLMWWLLPFLKNFLRSWEISADYSWYGCTKKLKIFLAACIESTIMTIWLIWERCVTWIVLHLIVKSLASVDVTLTIWLLRLLMIDLTFIFISYFSFFFFFSFIFLFLEQLGLGVISHAVTISHNLMA